MASIVSVPTITMNATTGDFILQLPVDFDYGDNAACQAVIAMLPEVYAR
jgi:hypothetical protein